MYFLRLFTLLTVLSSLSLTANADAALNTEKQKFSYAMGIFFSQNVTQQNIDLDAPAFLQAIDDMLNGSEPKLTKEEMNEVLTRYQKKETKERLAGAVKRAGRKGRRSDEDPGAKGRQAAPGARAR